MLFNDECRVNLPYCAFFGSDLNVEWLANASKKEQEEALFNWFILRFEDPVHSLPYISREGGYQYIYGDPVDPEDEISQFEDITSIEVVQNVVQRLYDIAGDSWSPIPDYSDCYKYDETPINNFLYRIDTAIQLFEFSRTAKIIDVETLIDEAENYEQYGKAFLIHQLENKSKEKYGDIYYLQRLSVFSLFVTAFETYLWEITKINLNTLKLELRKNLINSLKDFQCKKTLSEIYNENYNFNKRLEDILDNETVWHNINNINLIFRDGFKLNELPDFSKVSDLLKTRNNIVHRFGLDKDGHAISLTDSNILEAKEVFIQYCEQLDAIIQERIKTL